MPSLTNFGRFSRMRLFDYDVFDRTVYLQLPRANGPLRVLLLELAIDNDSFSTLITTTVQQHS